MITKKIEICTFSNGITGNGFLFYSVLPFLIIRNQPWRAVCLFRVSLFLTILLLFSAIGATSYEDITRNARVSVLVASGGEKSSYPRRNDIPSRQYTPRQRLPPCLKAKIGLRLAKLSLYAGYLVLLSGDVSLNPGPPRMTLNCALCRKVILERQACLPFSVCDRMFHLNCLGAEFEVSKCCRLCDSSGEEDSESQSSNTSLCNKLKDITKIRGMKIIHQNIQRLGAKIEQLRLLIRDLNSDIHLITLSETWAKRDVLDGEFHIPGYRLFRKDRVGKHGGVAVFAREDLIVSRRKDLEIDSVEALWIEVSLPKTRSFLVGTFYRPDHTSKYYDKEFMGKLNSMLDTVSAEDKEMIVLGDFNCCFLRATRCDVDCKQLYSLFRFSDLKQLITEPTCITKDSKSLIVLIAASCPMNICAFGVISSHLSDHEMTYCIRKLN